MRARRSWRRAWEAVAAGRCRAGFTLLEVLLAIMLLSVLMMVSFPAFRGLERAAGRHRAVAEADAIAQAAIAYRRVYGQWPLEELAGEPPLAALSPETAAIVAGKDVGEHLALSNVVAVLRNADPAHNPRRMLFLELPDSSLDADGTPLDPWREPYVLVMARVGEEDGSLRARQGGGVSAIIAGPSSSRRRRKEPALVDGPEDAVAFSWGDPASIDDEPWLFSWSKR